MNPSNPSNSSDPKIERLYQKFFKASQEGDIAVIKNLIDGNLDVNYQDEQGCNALIIASQYEKIDVVNVLIANGAKVNAANLSGSTPLHIATANENHEIIKLLIEAEADINAVNLDLHNPFFFADSKGNGNKLNQIIDECRKNAIRKLKDDLRISATDIDESTKQEKITELEMEINHLTETPSCFKCTLSNRLFKNPKMTIGGESYEEEYIKHHFNFISKNDPKTGFFLGQNPRLILNYTFKKVIEDFVKDNTEKSFKALLESIKLGREDLTEKLVDRIKDINDGKFFTCEVIKNIIEETKTRSDRPGIAVSIPSSDSQLERSQGARG